MRSLVRLFRFLLRVQGAVIVGVDCDQPGDSVVIKVRRRRNAKPRCSSCNKVMAGEIKSTVRKWRHLDLMGTKTYLLGQIREGRCSVHGRRMERIPWADSRAHHTRVFDRHVASLAQVADKSATARMFDVSWRTVGRIIKRVVGRMMPKDLLKGVTHIAVDETSYKRGHRYLTVVTCLRSGLVLWVSEGKSAEPLTKFGASGIRVGRQGTQAPASMLRSAFVRSWTTSALLGLCSNRVHHPAPGVASGEINPCSLHPVVSGASGISVGES